jgi:hypothetical protein
MKPSNCIPNATGIPPHVKELGLFKAALNTCGKTLQTFKVMIPELKECMKEGITEAADHLVLKRCVRVFKRRCLESSSQ